MKVIFIVLFAAALSGCAHTFKCEDGTKLRVYFKRHAVRVITPVRAVVLEQAPSASGARYGDSRFEFWNKGNTAFVRSGDEVIYRDCVEK